MPKEETVIEEIPKEEEAKKEPEDRGDKIEGEDETKSNVDKVTPEELDEEVLKKIAADEEEIKEKGGKVPSYRLRQEADKRRIVEAEYAALKAEHEELKSKKPETVKTETVKEPPSSELSKAFDYEAAEDAYIDAVNEGEKEKAKEIRRIINANIKYDNEQMTNNAIATERYRLTTVQRLDAVTQGCYKDYPFLNFESESANNELIEKITKERNELYRVGIPINKALEKAIKIYKEEIDEYAESLLEPEEPEGEEKSKGKQVEEDRKKTAVQKNIEAAKKQPPKLKAGTGDKVTQFDASKLSERDFDTLPESEKRRMRGDIA